MVCNTIHLYHQRLQAEIETPILDLRQELARVLNDKGIKSTLVIGTPNTIRQGLYRIDGVEAYEPDEGEIQQLSEAISNFNCGIDRDEQVRKARDICDKYLKLGVEVVILGCTEFAVMLGEEDLPKINTIDVLVNATRQKFLSNNTK